VPEVVVLQGRLVRLEPLSLDHVPALVVAANEQRSSYASTAVPEQTDTMADYVGVALAEQAAGRVLPFATIEGERVVGSTRFLDLEYWEPSAAATPRVAEIGSTWLAASAQRRGVNTEAKLLMLSHAFEQWQVYRVTFKTDARNEQSRRAIERIGATFEGIRRAHLMATDGTIRDSAYFSIIVSEWPEVKQRLCALARR
jgi:RimJ/RimL family protein N-acetyltransferase